MDFSSFLVVPIVVLCLITGYIVKHIIPDTTIQNKWIPVIVTIEGIIVNVILAVSGVGLAGVTAESIVNAIVAGGISGASSTGFQSAFSAFIENTTQTEDVDSSEALG